MRHLFSAILILSIAAASLAGTAQNAQLRLVSTAWSPFTNVAGEPRFALDLVETALRRVNITATTTIVEAAQFTPALLTGPYDGSAAAWRDPEREQVLLFSQPYLENRLILVGRKGADVGPTALTALTGSESPSSVGTRTGTSRRQDQSLCARWARKTASRSSSRARWTTP
jgi:ABC-type amino acid transport substrate-binding protein